MIIHIWMHWFWITTASLKGFLLFFFVQMISLSCISQELTAEAGLLNNDTLINHTYLRNQNESSQIGHNPNITLSPVGTSADGGVSLQPETTSQHQLFLSSPLEEINTEAVENESAKSEDISRLGQGPTSDVEDTYNGGNLDVFQYPLKKFTKYSHIKYGRVKMKGKPSEESAGEEKKVESVKIVEEKVNINFTIAGDNAGHVEPEVDKVNGGLAEGNSSEVVTGENVELITTARAFESSTPDGLNETESEVESFATEEPVPRIEPMKLDNATAVPTTIPTPGLHESSEIPNVIEDQKDVQVRKNDTLVIENKVEESVIHTTVEPFLVKNRVAAATSAQNYNEVNQADLNAGSITGITLGILVVFSLFGAVSFVLYRRRYLNKPQVLHDKCSNLDSSGYIDDTSLRENSEEMYSLDNDSFLNSLEAMTIQNYWTESVKHTKL